MDDDWQPDPFSKQSITSKVLVSFTDNIIKRELRRDEDKPYDPTPVYTYAEQYASDDDDLDPEYLTREEKDRMRTQHKAEQVYFDPLEDLQNEEWISRKMKPSGQAVLSCPMCFIQVCYDWQRHEEYHTQYRAMFARNCKIDCSKVVQPQGERKTLDIYFSVDVVCSQCETQVAVFEMASKLYHFFNVVTGYG